MKTYLNCKFVKLYDIECLCNLFGTDLINHVKIDTIDNKIFIDVKINKENLIKSIEMDVDPNKCEQKIYKTLFDILSKITGKTPPWGILTGIRPVKLFRNTCKVHGLANAQRIFKDDFLVKQPKIDLANSIMNTQEKFLKISTNNSVSLYISIPFCPTKCSYCSFVSSSVEKSMHLMNKYVDLLCLELQKTATIINDLNLRLQTVYIGGGTPTTLSAQQLRQLILCVRTHFHLDNSIEFTVEAGRPDTITKEKLLQLKSLDVSRISINPQTLNDDVLETIGRKHSAKQTIDAFHLARSLGFDNINMDLIVGLPTDTFESFKSTLLKILSLNPENITIHTLSIKRAARLGNDLLKQNNIVSQMLSFAHATLPSAGFSPYYLYRQSNMIGNFENVGWSIPGKECAYNVYIMDEIHTILSCGAGAVTKIKDPFSSDVDRVFNFKYPYEYISRFDEILKRKEQILKKIQT